MAEVPEHRLKRSAERRKAVGLPVPGEEGGDAPAADAPTPDAPADEAAAPAAEVPAAAAASDTPAEDVETASGTKIPAHLLDRAKRRRAAVAGGDSGAAVAAGAGRAHAAPAHRGQVGFDPADQGRGAGQGARVAGAARGRVGVDPHPARRR